MTDADMIAEIKELIYKPQLSIEECQRVIRLSQELDPESRMRVSAYTRKARKLLKIIREREEAEMGHEPTMDSTDIITVLARLNGYRNSSLTSAYEAVMKTLHTKLVKDIKIGGAFDKLEPDELIDLDISYVDPIMKLIESTYKGFAARDIVQAFHGTNLEERVTKWLGEYDKRRRK